MAEGKRRYVDAVPEQVETALRRLCMVMPEVYEERAWAGTRWMIRKRTFAHVLSVISPNNENPVVILSFRSTGEELDILRLAGHPFFVLGWGRDAMGMVLDENTQWDEVSELVTESFCVLAPKKLVASVDRG